MPFGTEVGLGSGHIVLDGDPAPPRKGTQKPPSHFSAHFALARSPISATAELFFVYSTSNGYIDPSAHVSSLTPIRLLFTPLLQLATLL